MPRNRRRFLAYFTAATTAGVGGAGWWLAYSKQRAARWARRIVAEARRPVQPAPFKPQPKLWSANNITISWLGHTTVLLNFFGIRILTDPALGNHIGVSFGLGTIGPKRFVAPALKLRELPPIDVILLSHAHMDHMDLASLSGFAKETFTVTANATRDVLTGTGLKKINEIAWGDRVIYRGAQGDLQIEAIEVKHWGQRWPSQKDRGYNGYILRREGKSVLFAGDTALTPALGRVKARGPFEVAIMPIGAYRPWIWNHCTPEQALEMANAAGAKYIVPVHHQTFKLSEEPNLEPIERLQAALEREPERLGLRQIGQTFQAPV